MTLDAARQDGAADWKGSLEIGKVADLTVLDENPLEPGRPFTALSVEGTIVDGRTVFARHPLNANALGN